MRIVGVAPDVVQLRAEEGPRPAIYIPYARPAHEQRDLHQRAPVTLFLFIEARRYRYYEPRSSRVRLMETDFFATMLVPPFKPAPDWAESLAANLLHAQFTISVGEALGRENASREAPGDHRRDHRAQRDESSRAHFRVRHCAGGRDTR